MNTTEQFSIPTSQFQFLNDKINSLPLWVKQAVYCKLKNNLAECSDIALLDRIENNIIQLYKPQLTFTAKKASYDPAIIEYSENFFLNDTETGLNLLEIAHKNTWNLKETCSIMLSLIEKGLIENFNNEATYNFVLYITEKIRLGEFLVRTNRLTTEQLDKALYAKKCTEQMGDEVSFKDVLGNLGYLNKKDIDKIASIKESSLETINIIDDSMSHSDELIVLQDQLDALQFEKKKLEDKINFYKKELEEKNMENLELIKQLEKYSKGFMGKFLTSLS